LREKQRRQLIGGGALREESGNYRRGNARRGGGRSLAAHSVIHYRGVGGGKGRIQRDFSDVKRRRAGALGTQSPERRET